MNTPNQKYRPSKLIIMLLGCVAATTIATSAIPGSNGRTRTQIDWRGPSQRMMVTVAPIEDRLDVFGYEGPFHITLKLRSVPQTEAAKARWSFDVSGSEDDSNVRAGEFIFGGEVYSEDDGSVTGDLIAPIGVICQAGFEVGEDCITCDLTTGCVFEIDVDRCHPVGDEFHDMDLIVGPPGGQALELSCDEDLDEEPCRRIARWLESEAEPTDAVLCTSAEMSGSETQ